MLENDLRQPPQVPDAHWLQAFAYGLQSRRPQLSDGAASTHALLAHSFTWLLDASEAAELWEHALSNQLSQWKTWP